MKLLICAQAVDMEDPVLGFFHRWIEEFSKKYQQVSVICLREGTHALPGNVRVYSLGKERGARPAFIYASRFVSLVWRHRREYDSVFVHMNQEYVLLAGLLWKTLGKKVYLWRNHYAGGFFTRVAVLLSHKVFCTSRSSFTARFKKVVLMPVGVDTDVFAPSAGIERRAGSILSLGRIAPSKNIHVILGALEILKNKGIMFAASIYGDPLSTHDSYYESLKRCVVDAGLQSVVSFHPGVKNADTPQIYSAHQIFVNASASGMLDKTIFEALACGCVSIACGEDYAIDAPEYSFLPGNIESLADKIKNIMTVSSGKKTPGIEQISAMSLSKHSLVALFQNISKEMRL